MYRLMATAIITFGLAGSAVAEPHDVFATFLTHDGGSHIQISDCGDGTPCGTIVWINPETLPAGYTAETAVGQNGAPILGATLLQDFERKRKDWRGGTVYDPENDKLYAARLKRLDDRNLQLKGCIGMFCQTQVWTLVPNKLASRE